MKVVLLCILFSLYDPVSLHPGKMSDLWLCLSCFIVHFWPGETYSTLLSGLHVQDIWMLMTGKPMQLVIRVRAFFLLCYHKQPIIWYFCWHYAVHSLETFQLQSEGAYLLLYKENLLEWLMHKTVSYKTYWPDLLSPFQSRIVHCCQKTK